MTFDLVLRVIVSGAYVLYSLRQKFQICSVDAYLGMKSVAHHFWVTLTLNNRVQSISLILFDVGISNVV